jgi:hypothetical protein
MPRNQQELHRALKNELKKYRNFYFDERDERPIAVKSVGPNETIGFSDVQLYPQGTTIDNCTGGSCNCDTMITVTNDEAINRPCLKKGRYDIYNIEFEITNEDESREVTITNDKLTIHPYYRR